MSAKVDRQRRASGQWKTRGPAQIQPAELRCYTDVIQLEQHCHCHCHHDACRCRRLLTAGLPIRRCRSMSRDVCHENALHVTRRGRSVEATRTNKKRRNLSQSGRWPVGLGLRRFSSPGRVEDSRQGQLSFFYPRGTSLLTPPGYRQS